VLTGAAKGLKAGIKVDRIKGSLREIVLWQALRADVAVGDTVRLVAGV